MLLKRKKTPRSSLILQKDQTVSLASVNLVLLPKSVIMQKQSSEEKYINSQKFTEKHPGGVHRKTPFLKTCKSSKLGFTRYFTGNFLEISGTTVL